MHGLEKRSEYTKSNRHYAQLYIFVKHRQKKNQMLNFEEFESQPCKEVVTLYLQNLCSEVSEFQRSYSIRTLSWN